MRHVFLIRHPEIMQAEAKRYYGVTDVDLSQRGEEQAQLLADHLSSQPAIETVFSSHLKRTQRPAGLLAQRLKIFHRIEPDLGEINFGSWEGLAFQEMLGRDPQLYRDWLRMAPNFGFPQGESLAQFQQRVIPAYKRIALDGNDGASAAVFTHGGVIKLILADLLVIPWGQVNCLRQSFGAVNIIDYQDGVGVLQLMNDTCYQGDDNHG